MKLALKLPGGNEILQPKELVDKGFVDLASFISPLLNIAFYAAMLFAFAWLTWGAFAYLMAQGKKEDLAKARARITWAVVGLIIIFSAYMIAKFAAEIFPPTTGGIPF